MADIKIREAKRDDAFGMAKVRVETWQSAYRGIIPDDYLDHLSIEQNAIRWRDLLWDHPTPGLFSYVAENDLGHIVGIAVGGPEQSQDMSYRGEINVLYVLPVFQHQGIGRRLVNACARKLIENGMDSLLIWVLADNLYRKFYEAMGGKPVREKEEEIAGIKVKENGYGWVDIRDI